MKKILVGISLLISSFSFAQSAKNWKVDNVHSSVRFSVSHLVISEVEGIFKVYDGSISNTKDDFSDAKIDFNIDVASINTENSMRDNHLKSDDFFNTEKFPKMTFKSTSFKKKAGNMYELTGDLTIRDVTKKAVFSVKYGGTQKDGYGNTKAGFKVTGSINRFDYGLKWNALTEAGGATVGKEVELVGNLEFALAK
jgi:polyisoprenoid-binding protein YceI